RSSKRKPPETHANILILRTNSQWVRPTASFPRALFLPEIPDVDHKTIPRRLGTIGPRVVATSPAGPDRLCRSHGQFGQGGAIRKNRCLGAGFLFSHMP